MTHTNKTLGRFFFLASVCLLLSNGNIIAQDNQTSPNDRRPVNGDKVKKLYETNLAKYKNSPDILVLPGLVANRKEKKVEIQAEATGLKGNDISEFLVVDQNSGHGYEALLWSFAKPSDVHKALVFIGVPPGEPFNPQQLRLHPKGELINVSLLQNDKTNNPGKVMIENLILDRSKDKPLPETGFLFTGSMQIPAQDGQTGTTYAADIYEPKSIVSAFNEPTTVLDVPRQANQNEVYNDQVVNPAYELPANELLTLIMEPARKDGGSRTKNIVMEIGVNLATTGSTNSTPAPAANESQFTFLLKDAEGKTLGNNTRMEDSIATINALKSKGFDPYLSIRFSNSLKLSEVRKLCLVISMLEPVLGISIEPPDKNQVYYKAFMPDERWRDRQSRIAQPWELHLAANKNKVSGTLFQNEEIWGDDNSITPKIKTTQFDVPTPRALREKLDEDAKQRKLADKRPGLPVLLVFADANLTYGDFMLFVEPVLPTHNTVHVFLPEGN